ncbi:MAG: ATP-binding protein [Rhodoferax sp.]|nr:ATP-binding protein [Rhodoferax sp.]
MAEALADTPGVLLNGACQTGKSTLAQMLAARDGRRYLTLDDRVARVAARSDPTGFIAGLSGPVVMDEIQRVPELFLDIKAAVDRDRTPGRFLLTGSANVLLLPSIADSLAGRMQTLALWPLSNAEQADGAVHNRADALFDGTLSAGPRAPYGHSQFITTLLQGGFPEAVARTATRRRAAWFESYVDTILQRDVRDLARLEQPTELPNPLQMLAARSATLLNFAELSRASGLTQTTLKRYFSLLEMLFLVVRIPAWARNAGKRLVKAPKVFLPDSGMLAWLSDMSPEKLQALPGLPGALVETWVAAELLKHLAFSQRGLSLWHYRTQTDIEVDVVLEDRQGRLTGIEVKAAASVDGSSFKGLRHLQDTEPERFRRGVVQYGGSELVAFSERLFAVPLSWWCANEPSTRTPSPHPA